jgi:hypothetical protein
MMKYGSDTWCTVCCKVASWALALSEFGRDFDNLYDTDRMIMII